MTPREKLDLLRSYRAAGGTGSYASLLKESKQYDGGGVIKEKSMMEAPVLPENTFPYNNTSFMFKDETYNSKRANELYEPDEMGHMPTVDYTTGEWLKAKRYPTSWKELMATQLNSGLNKMVGHPYQNEKGNLQYPKGYGYALGGPKSKPMLPYSPEALASGTPAFYKQHPLYPQHIPTIKQEDSDINIEKLKSKINPKNWGVTDYTDNGDFNKAYSSAKSDGKDEFMWNNKKYNTKYAGTPRQEAGAYGIKGEAVHPMDLNSPIQVNQYKEVVSKYFPGHIEAGIPKQGILVDGINKGSDGRNKKKFRPSDHIKDQVYVYGADNFDPTKANPGYNLLFNNCADAACDAFGLPKKGITTPKETMSKIKDTFQTIDVKGRTYKDYFNEWRDDKKNILNKSEYWLGISNSPDIQGTQLGRNIIESMQKNLVKEGYSLPKSKQKYENSYDGVYGEETSKALSDWKQKKKK